MKAEIERSKSGQGSLSDKFENYRIYIRYKITYYDDETEKKSSEYGQKYFSTDIPVKGNNLRKAKQLFKTIFDRFDPYHPDVPLALLLRDQNSDTVAVNDGLTAPQSDSETMGKPAAHASSHINTPSAQEKLFEDDILFTEFLQTWLEYKKDKVEKTTYSVYRLNVESKIIPYFEEKGIYLNQLTSKDVHQFYSYMRSHGASERNKASTGKNGLSSETIRRLHSNIRKALVDAASDEFDLLHTNILSTLKRPEKNKIEEFEAEFYSLDEINALLEASEGHKLEVPIKLAVFYGLRREEVLGLRWPSVNFDDDLITINHTVTQCYYNGAYQIVTKNRAKSESSMRSLQLDAGIKTLLLNHKRQIEKNKRLMKGSYNKVFLSYVCVDEMGNLWKPGYITKSFKKLLEEHNLRPIRFHDLRHSCSSLLLSKGVPMRFVQEFLGHSTYATTEKYYGHLDDSAKKVSVNTISNAGLKIVRDMGENKKDDKDGVSVIK